MITAESLFFAILGTTRAEITPSVLATEITAELLFDENLGFDDFRITKDVYPTVAQAPAPQLRFGIPKRRAHDCAPVALRKPGAAAKNHRAGAAAAASRPGNDPVSGVLSACGASDLCARYGTDVRPESGDQRVMILPRVPRPDGDVRNVAAMAFSTVST